MHTKSKRPLQTVRTMFKWGGSRGASDSMASMLNRYASEAWAKELGAFIRELNTAERLGGSVWAHSINRVNTRLGSMRFTLQLVRTREGLERSWLPAVWDGSIDANDRNVPLGLAMIADLAAMRELVKLRECDYCKQWFVAPRNRKSTRFCKGKGCRKAWHGKTPHGREMQREYTKRSRANKKRMIKAQERVTRAFARSRKLGQA